MTHPFSSPLLCAAALLLGLASGPAQADKADRSKPLTVEADKPGTVDLLKQVVVFNGNVVIAQGTMRIRADRVEVRESADGYRAATAIGSPGAPANFRQKREGLDEFIEGSAQRIELDGRGDTLRFIGSASVRRLRGNVPADEITGNLIAYDNVAEVFSVQGGPAGDSNGRVRAVLTPRENAEPAASAASSAPTELR
jgi:lipopolysaccharide export system protein LptA